MQFPLADFVSKTVACEILSVNCGYNALDALFASLRTNKTVRKLRVAMVMNLPYPPCDPLSTSAPCRKKQQQVQGSGSLLERKHDVDLNSIFCSSYSAPHEFWSLITGSRRVATLQHALQQAWNRMRR